MDHRCASGPGRRFARAASAAALAAAVLAFSPGVSSADIIRWTDDQGVVHFTDDRSTIPASQRGKSSVVIKEEKRPARPNGSAQPPAAAPEPPPAALELSGPSGEIVPPAADPDAERLRARIAAKEAFIRQVDEKRSPAGNAYRNRFVDQADLDLYRKYQEELRADRAALEALEGGGSVR